MVLDDDQEKKVGAEENGKGYEESVGEGAYYM